MNISGYIAANTWGYDVAKTSQTTSTKSFTVSIGEKQTQKTLNNADTNPFDTSSFNFKEWRANKETSFDIQMYTKTEPTRSDEEILKDMAELAKKHAQQGTFHELDKEYLALMEEYMSSVSPDREGILNRAVNEIIDRTKQDEDYTMSDIYRQVKSQTTEAEQKDEDELKKEMEGKELIDYFIEAIESRGNRKGDSGTISGISQNGDSYSVNINNGDGMTTELTYANGEIIAMQMNGNNYHSVQLENVTSGSVNHVMFTDDDGNLIAAYYNKGGKPQGLRSAPTYEETERRKEVLAAYNAGYDFATGKYLPIQTSDPNKETLLIGGKRPPTNSKSQEIYNSTYDRLTNNVVA